mmetsp:Transcript_53168/g.105721  ORF Transcript_53168/g.105721 Transcript_53168/m.105721 type:complete len:114 (-) Transcript_53168:73-414(-)
MMSAVRVEAVASEAAEVEEVVRVEEAPAADDEFVDACVDVRVDECAGACVDGAAACEADDPAPCGPPAACADDDPAPCGPACRVDNGDREGEEVETLVFSRALTASMMLLTAL